MHSPTCLNVNLGTCLGIWPCIWKDGKNSLSKQLHGDLLGKKWKNDLLNICY